MSVEPVYGDTLLVGEVIGLENGMASNLAILRGIFPNDLRTVFLNSSNANFRPSTSALRSVWSACCRLSRCRGERLSRLSQASPRRLSLHSKHGPLGSSGSICERHSSPNKYL